MRRRKFDPIASLEALYSPAQEMQSWLDEITASLAPLDLGIGRYARIDDHRDYARIRVLAVSSVGPTAGELVRFFMEQGHPQGDGELQSVLYRPTPPLLTAWHKVWSFGLDRTTRLRKHFASLGWEDSWGLVCKDRSGLALVTGIAVPQRYALPPPPIRHQLLSISTHGVSALRLRAFSSDAGDQSFPQGAEAVFTPSGRMCDAIRRAKERGSREHLVDAVRRMDRARGVLRWKSPEEALQCWYNLIDGRWSLVDHVERDGKRWVLARRNSPISADPKSMTDRERNIAIFAAMGHSNKHIGYLLGIAPSTVSGHLENARRKLGVTSRREIIQMLNGRAQPEAVLPDRPVEHGPADPRLTLLSRPERPQ